MRIWTNGELTRVWHPAGRLRVEKGAWFRETKTRGRNDEWAHGDSRPVIAPTPSRGEDLVDRWKGGPLVDALACDETRIAAVVAREDDALLWIGPVDGPPEVELPLVAKATHVRWPDGEIGHKGSPWFSPHDLFGGRLAPRFHRPFWRRTPRLVRIGRSAQGIALAAAGSGHIAVLRPGAVHFDFVLRLPLYEAADVYAVPTETGVIATMSATTERTVALELDHAGEILRHTYVDRGVSTGIVFEGEVVIHDFGSGRLHGICPNEHIDGLVQDMAVAADGKSFALCTETEVVQVRSEGGSLQMERCAL
ncbi:MAG: hypothetical protein AAGE52_07670 [Myxococcota bacterium]